MDELNLLTVAEAFMEMYEELFQFLENGDLERAHKLAKRMAGINSRFVERHRHVLGLREMAEETPELPRLLDPELN